MLNVESPRAANHPLQKAKPLTLLPLVALIFYDVSGGPFGIEDAVSKGAPLLALLGFLILPFAWSIPEALVTAELATTFPENSGFVAWVTAAFGPWWGFQEGFWKWLSGVTDNAVYPVIFLTYLQQLVPVLESGIARSLFLVGLNLALTYMNYRGLHVVGKIAIAMTAFTLLPFIIMCLLGVPHVHPSNWLVVDWSTVQWVPFLNVMFWSLNYWDSVSTLAGEVSDPAKTFPRALSIAVVLVMSAYLLPLLIGLGIVADSSDWTLGYFATVAEHVGGKWLAWWIVVAAAVSQLGQFEAEMSTDSYQLLGMAERGFIPSVFAKRSSHGTPTYAILASSIGIAAMASFNFLEIVELLNVVYCMAEMLEFIAFLWLRIKYPLLHRPFKIPLSTVGCAIMLAPAFILLSIMLMLPVFRGDWHVVGFTFLAFVLGAVLYPLMQYMRQEGWCEFEGVTPDEFKEHLYTTYTTVRPHASAGSRESDLMTVEEEGEEDVFDGGSMSTRL
jgi:amino acid transporter